MATYRTLAELRTDVLRALGFIDPYSNPPTATMSVLRAKMREQLGIPDAMGSFQQRTFLLMRNNVLERLGSLVL